MIELRKETREPSTGAVLYTLISDDTDHTHAGLLYDMSQSGACIYTQDRIADEKIRIYFSGLSQKPVNAKVMWCFIAVDDLYRAGIMLN